MKCQKAQPNRQTKKTAHPQSMCVGSGFDTMSHPNLITTSTSTAKQVIKSHDCLPILTLGSLRKKNKGRGTFNSKQLTCSYNKCSLRVQHKHQQMHKTIPDKSLMCDLEVPKEQSLNRTHSALVMSTDKGIMQ